MLALLWFTGNASANPLINVHNGTGACTVQGCLYLIFSGDPTEYVNSCHTISDGGDWGFLAGGSYAGSTMFRVRVKEGASGTGPTVFEHDYPNTASTYNETVTSCTGIPTTYTNRVACITYTNTMYYKQKVTATVYYTGGTNQVLPSFDLPLNGTRTYCVTNTHDSFILHVCGQRPDWDTDDCHDANSHDETGTYGSGGPDDQSQAGTTNPPPPNVTDTNTLGIVRAVTEAASKITKDADQNALATQGTIRSNASGGTSLTNYATESTLQATLQAITNKLGVLQSTANSNAAQAHGDFMSMTNSPYTNSGGVLGYLAGLIPATATNGTSATNSAWTELSGQAGGIDSAVSGFGSAPTLGTPNAAILAFDFIPGYQINADPENQFPGLMSWVKGLWTIILSVLFARHVGKLLWEAAKTFASAEGGGVPDLEATVAFGWGGNVLGIAVALLVPAALVFIWKAVFNYFLGGAISSALSSGSTVSSFSLSSHPSSAAALYLLDSSFPISLFFSLLLTGLAMHFLAAKVVMLASAGSRWLWTK